MKKSLTKVLCSMLAMAFLFGFVALPGMVRVSAANEYPSVVSEITLADSDTTAANTLGTYPLLQDPTEGFTMEEGDVYVFDMDIRGTVYEYGGVLKAFVFDLLGNPAVYNSANLIRTAGVKFWNRMVLNWNTGGWEYHTLTATTSPNGDGKFAVGESVTYRYRFTVDAYKSIRVQIWSPDKTGAYAASASYDGSVAWSSIYGLHAVKSGDGTKFKPTMAFLDQNGKISNIAVRYTGTNGGAIKTVDEIKLEDSDTTSEFTMAKYDLLKSTEGITLEEGGTYVFDMDIWRATTDSGAVRRDVFFDLLGNVQLKSDNKQLMVGSGVYYGSRGTFMYWKTAWENAFVTTSTPFDIWTGSESAATYHYRFTVKAYESIRVEFWSKSTAQGYSDFPADYDGTVAWNNVYGLKDLKPGDGTKFKPAMAFFDQNGKISNIHAVYIPASAPVFTEAVADISAYRTEGAYTAPEKDGYVFAGWFADEACTTPVTTQTTNVYAKWVTEDVLSVKAQVLAGTTAASESTDLRFLTTVDSLDYQNIGFRITINAKTNTPASTSVYKTITARSDGAVVAKDPTVFSEVSEYFHTYTITKIPSSAFGTGITVTPYWTTLDGTVANGVARTLTVNEIISTIANA